MRTLLSFLRRQESIQLILHPSPPSRRGRTEVGVTSILSFSQRFRASEESHHFCHSRMPVSGIQLLIPHFERARNHHTSVILPVRRSFNEDGNLIQDLSVSVISNDSKRARNLPHFCHSRMVVTCRSVAHRHSRVGNPFPHAIHQQSFPSPYS